MICTSKIHGGLGNVLFQMAIGLSFSKDNNYNYAIFNNSFGMTTHTPNESYFDNIFKNITWNKCNYDQSFQEVYETDQAYQSYDVPDTNICFSGYFQSYKYFDHNYEHIKNSFHLERKDMSSDYCSIHVRRGDYLHYPNVYEQMSLEYYTSAMNSIGSDKNFLVFTNDIPWCVETFKDFPNVKIINESDPFKSLSLMASCKNHIISNSTFSWWGAYLSDNSNVICPKKWFTKDFAPTITKKSYDDFMSDMIPDSWKLI